MNDTFKGMFVCLFFLNPVSFREYAFRCHSFTLFIVRCGTVSAKQVGHVSTSSGKLPDMRGDAKLPIVL